MSTKLIFICVFFNQSYVTLALNLIESIYKFGKLDNNTKILIYTSTRFMKMFKQSSLYTDKIIFHINDTKNNIDLACKSRIDLFHIPITKEFDQILYLDADIIITGDVNILFKCITKDLLYAIGIGLITDSEDYFGASLFGDTINNYEDKTGFCSGLLLFNNSETIRNLFSQIEEHIKVTDRYYSCYDQPFFVYNAIKNNIVDRKLLNTYDGKIFQHHFGGPGYADQKLITLPQQLQSVIETTSKIIIGKTKSYINTQLMPIINNIGEPLEGNIFMEHLSNTYTDVWGEKPLNICNILLDPNIIDVLEIGFNSGFSALLMLMANENIKLTCVDYCQHKYTVPCYNKMKETFGDRITLHCGDSRIVLPNLDQDNKFDLIHIDGGNDYDIVINDIHNCYILRKKELTHKTIIIMNDYNFPHIHQLWNSFISATSLQNITTKLINSDYHSVKMVTNFE